MERVRSGVFDFFLALRAPEAPAPALEAVVEEAKRRGLRVYAYVLVRTGGSVPDLVRGQPLVDLEAASELAARLEPYFDGFVVSSVGGSPLALVEAVRAVRRGLGG